MSFPIVNRQPFPISDLCRSDLRAGLGASVRKHEWRTDAVTSRFGVSRRRPNTGRAYSHDASRRRSEADRPLAVSGRNSPHKFTVHLNTTGEILPVWN